ncbi:MAG: ABC transporter ATP-binding protein [Candidatus Aminicenantes bacterium]|nr:ABC transporter ATP-binding protein [Candidatus Aminicenantes bacterium]
MVLPDAEAAELIRVEGLHFSRGGRPVLTDVSLSIIEGDFLAILGPNGSGKTTLLKIILGLLKPDQGWVRLFGRPPEDFVERELVGYIPQKATHFDPLFPASVREVVAMALRSGRRRISRPDEDTAVRIALETVDMIEFWNRRIGRLSGGQQQRVFIARAIARNPRILFLDEPTTGVDAENQDRFYDLLGRLNTSGRLTIVLVTHDTGIVNKHVNKVACLNQRLFFHGTHDQFCSSGALKEMIAGGHHLVLHRH